MGKVLETILFWLAVPVMVLLVLTLGTAISLQCKIEHKLHGTDYENCICEKEPLGCDNFPYGD
jgi:hypothetical protein